jgi:predicted ATPase
VVIVLGEAGIGKSRLMEEAQTQAVHEFDKTREELGGNSLLVHHSRLRWLEGRSLSYGGSLSFWSITQLLLADLGLSEGAPEVKIKVALGRRMKALYEGENESLPFLASLMGLKLGEEAQERISSLDGEDLRRKTLDAITSYFFRLAEERPTVLVFEDLHWADPSSLEALEHLLGLTDQVPLMVLCLMRVEREHGSWKVKLQAETDYPHRTTLIQLKRLSNSQSSHLVDQLLGESGLPEDLHCLVMARSEGNPLYLEEVIRHLSEHRRIVQDGESWRTTQEISEMGIPETLYGVLLARIDRLEEEVRRTLQMAAVIGRSFLYPAALRPGAGKGAPA